jgi:hypothetical protein
VSYTDVNVITFGAKYSKNIRASSVLPEILTRLRPGLTTCTLDGINKAVNNFIMAAASFTSSFVTQDVPGIKLQTFPTMASSEVRDWLI